MEDSWDCVIVGGGAAGLSAALVLGRARRRTLLVDAGAQSNSAAHGVGGLLGHDGRPPAELYAAGRSELASYPTVRVLDGEVATVRRIDGVFDVRLNAGQTESARRVLLATGMDYQVRELPGMAELWGRSVFHCPFCHGWEVADQPLGVLARGERAIHLALLLRNWSQDIVVLTDGPAEFDEDELRRFAVAGVRIDERAVVELESGDGELAAIRFADGHALPRRGLLVAATLRQRSALAAQLGVETATGRVAVDAVVVDALGRTSVPGVFAAGDLTGQMPQVAAAIAAGSATAAAVVQSLAADEFGLPFPDWSQHVNA
ncbi:NAD(P)/FAD-dependent oxidoreductase [Mycobacterium sp. 141]|uniref:NAD(P)/FAD-dependent oxidoreductase n=1 Tax=Mycobacterium sp. 141 TaxID=1120797 RepID=UPI00037E3C04|nr:NAD(P)/FAD-dependent oxidoreductase [Mycobacterium sp. 141]